MRADAASVDQLIVPFAVFCWFSAHICSRRGCGTAACSRRRLLAAGLLVALGAAVAGVAGELWRFGAGDDAAAARVERSVRRDFDRMTAVLSQIATAVASDPAAARGLSAGADGARALFDLVDRRLSEAGTNPDEVAVDHLRPARASRARGSGARPTFGCSIGWPAPPRSS